MVTISYSGTRSVESRPTDSPRDVGVGDNLALLLTARRRRHWRRTAWSTTR
jgi:hypothetical protein